MKLANGCWVDARRTQLVLADFGYASRTDRHNAYVGSAHFAAPEVHRCDEEAKAEMLANGTSAAVVEALSYSAAAADVWSLGVCLYALLATALPFNGIEETEEQRLALRAKVSKGVWDAPLLRSKGVKDLARRMMCVDVERRVTLSEVASHVWVTTLQNRV